MTPPLADRTIELAHGADGAKGGARAHGERAPIAQRGIQS
jgi:hypothetical protein